MRRRVGFLLGAVLTLGGCALPGSRAELGDVPSTAAVPAHQALEQLERLPVRPAGSKAGYRRAAYGAKWSDDVDVPLGHNGCDTRNDLLRRDLTNVTLKPGTRGCVVLSGTLRSPYTGRTLTFTRGQKGSVQVDHVVPLAGAWTTGASLLDEDTRQRLANDPANLLVVESSENAAKGDKDASRWLPPAAGYRCAYVTRQIQVKGTYRLWVTPQEKDAMRRVLNSCP